MKALALVFGLLLMPVAAVAADVTEMLRQFDQGTDLEKTILKGLVKANADGFAIANWDLKNSGKPPLFCEPVKISPTPEQLIDILRRWVEAHRAIDFPSAMALLFALKEAFPCPM